MTEHSTETLAKALYEEFPDLHNLAESIARLYGKAEALSFYQLMGNEVQFFWKNIARQLIEHSATQHKNEGNYCILNKKERTQLIKLQRLRCSDQMGHDKEEEPI